MERNWKEDHNLIRKLAKILLGDTLPNGESVNSFLLLDDASRAELQRWANMSDAEFAAAQRSGDSIRIDVDDVIRQLEEKYALDPQLLDDLLLVFDADDLELWEEISQWEDSDHDEPTEYFFSNPVSSCLPLWSGRSLWNVADGPKPELLIQRDRSCPTGSALRSAPASHHG